MAGVRSWKLIFAVFFSLIVGLAVTAAWLANVRV